MLARAAGVYTRAGRPARRCATSPCPRHCTKTSAPPRNHATLNFGAACSRRRPGCSGHRARSHRSSSGMGVSRGRGRRSRRAAPRHTGGGRTWIGARALRCSGIDP
eukprot:scaffold33420_cov68-Phaeocystis_antarctica.AAC.3